MSLSQYTFKILMTVRVQRVGGRLGNGQFGAVYEALNEETHERVAVKQIFATGDVERHEENVKVRAPTKVHYRWQAFLSEGHNNTTSP